jgi:GT2 family glycosyltransferase
MPRNLGYAGAANQAIGDWFGRQRSCRFAVIASHDLHVEREALRIMLNVAKTTLDFGVLSPNLQQFGPTTGDLKSDSSLVREVPGLEQREWVSGTCLLLRRDCVDQVGLFDERLFAYVEDVDYCLRAKDCGWGVGVVIEAWASGLGSRDPYAQRMMREANSVLLAAKRGGRSLAKRELRRLSWKLIRSSAGSLAFWRPPERRRLSTLALSQRLDALTRVREMLPMFIDGDEK